MENQEKHSEWIFPSRQKHDLVAGEFSHDDHNSCTQYEIKRFPWKQVNYLSNDPLVFLQVGTSLFASNVGSGHFIGLAGSAAAAGIGPITYEWNVRLQ